MLKVPPFFWKRLAIFVGAMLIVITAPYVLFSVLGLMTMDERIVLVNDTRQMYTVGNVVQSHDNAKFYLRDEGTMKPGDEMRFDSGWDNTRCLVIDGQGITFTSELFISSDSKNIAFKDIIDHTANISALLANSESHPCPHMDEIVGGP